MKGLGQKIKEKAKEKSIFLKGLCERVGITTSGLNLALKNNTLKISDLQKIAKILDVDFCSFFEQDEANIIKKHKEFKDIELKIQENKIKIQENNLNLRYAEIEIQEKDLELKSKESEILDSKILARKNRLLESENKEFKDYMFYFYLFLSKTEKKEIEIKGYGDTNSIEFLNNLIREHYGDKFFSDFLNFRDEKEVKKSTVFDISINEK